MTLLTVLTQPIESPLAKRLKAAWRTGRSFLSRTPLPSKPRFGGHYAVTRSLVEGLERIGADFNYNPQIVDTVGEVAVVLTNVDALRQAIHWKRKGRIRKLLAGPNLMVFSDECNGILGSQEIDVCLVPSDWVAVAYEEDMPSLKGRIQVWWAGVDEMYWRGPAKADKFGRSIVIYQKNSSEEHCRNVEEIVTRFGWSPRWIRYGQYDIEQYRRALSEARFAIFLSQSESQGIALSEAWAMDVPTLVWNPKELKYMGRTYTAASACPYLTAVTGCEWATTAVLERLVSKIDEIVRDCEPRAWVLKHMTDVHSAQAMLEIADCGRDQ